VILAGRCRAAALAAALALLFAACGEDLEARRLRREARRLTRQNENLREMIQATSERRLVAAEWLAVAVDEAAVKTVIDATLPQEADIGDRWHVQVLKAEVSFRSGSSLVKLDAQVTDKSSPDRIAYVVYEGGLDDIEVGADGRLQTRVLIDGVEVPAARAGGADASQLASIASQLAGQNLETLQGLLPAVAIPVRLQQNIAIEGLGDGPVQVDPGELPVKATVARVLPLSGRLWVFLAVETGPWRHITASASPPTRVTPAGTKTP
jgi:hypothetical protein